MILIYTVYMKTRVTSVGRGKKKANTGSSLEDSVRSVRQPGPGSLPLLIIKRIVPSHSGSYPLHHWWLCMLRTTVLLEHPFRPLSCPFGLGKALRKKHLVEGMLTCRHGGLCVCLWMATGLLSPLEGAHLFQMFCLLLRPIKPERRSQHPSLQTDASIWPRWWSSLLHPQFRDQFLEWDPQSVSRINDAYRMTLHFSRRDWEEEKQSLMGMKTLKFSERI